MYLHLPLTIYDCLKPKPALVVLKKLKFIIDKLDNHYVG